MPLQHLQNRAACAITGIHDWNVQSTEIIKMLNWMSVRERYEYLSRVLMHKCIFKTSPSYLTSIPIKLEGDPLTLRIAF